MSVAAVERGARLRDGRYEVERMLGRGGAATVWLGRDTLLERPVAIKVLSPALADDDAWLARFRREARLAAQLSHPNLVSVYDFDAEAESPYLVMAYLPGGSLADRLARGERIAGERLARDVLTALAHIHEAGIVHRDVKPGNVLFAPDDRACLTDFGVARPEDATSITQIGQIPGTRRYMAPELWRGEPADERSDLYACGVMLAQCVDDDSPPRLRALVGALAEDDRELRPGSAAAALADLDAGDPAPTAPLEPTVEHTAHAPAPVGPVPGTSGDDRRRRRVAVAAGAAALAAALLAAVVLAVNDGDPQEPASRGGEERAASAGGEGGGDGEKAPVSDSGEPEGGYDPARGARLNDRGFALMNEGRYDEAIPVLERAVASFPPGTDDITYAYALFNLGKSLRLAGRPEEAIPYLRERLEIPDQTEVVQRELDLALAEAEGGGGPEQEPPGEAKGKEKEKEKEEKEN